MWFWKSIYFILVRTHFASNLGAAARVMKNMGFGNLVLVQPQCEVGIEARALAMKGAEVLDQACYCSSLEALSSTFNLLIGTTARFESQKHLLITPRKLAGEILPRYSSGKIGIVFGPEDNGLSRDELKLCHWWLEIPTGSNYAVLNLAQAVAIIAYELHQTTREQNITPALDIASPEEFKRLLVHIRETIEKSPLTRRFIVKRLLWRLQKIVGRAQLEKQDVNMLHGLLTELEKFCQEGSVNREIAPSTNSNSEEN
ncbi:MAG: RNA methyltransferase [Acidobacteria bacterium]|nr:RNA methyltransferase [Acidobacteriota bacterium]